MCVCMCARRPRDIATCAPTERRLHLSWTCWLDLLYKHIFRQFLDLICFTSLCLSVSLSVCVSCALFFFLWVSLSVSLSVVCALSTTIERQLHRSWACWLDLRPHDLIMCVTRLICPRVTWLSERQLHFPRTYWLDLQHAPALHEVGYVLSFICVWCDAFICAT